MKSAWPVISKQQILIWFSLSNYRKNCICRAWLWENFPYFHVHHSGGSILCFCYTCLKNSISLKRFLDSSLGGRPHFWVELWRCLDRDMNFCPSLTLGGSFREHSEMDLREKDAFISLSDHEVKGHLMILIHWKAFWNLLFLLCFTLLPFFNSHEQCDVSFLKYHAKNSFY